jgi:hypothetical protein
MEADYIDKVSVKVRAYPMRSRGELRCSQMKRYNITFSCLTQIDGLRKIDVPLDRQDGISPALRTCIQAEARVFFLLPARPEQLEDR